MNSWRRAVLTVLGFGLCLSLFFGFRYARVHGAFESIDPVTPGLCRAIAKGLIAQDLEIDPAHNTHPGFAVQSRVPATDFIV